MDRRRGQLPHLNGYKQRQYARENPSITSQSNPHSLFYEFTDMPHHCLQKNLAKSGFESYWSCKSTKSVKSDKSRDSNQHELKCCLRIHQKGSQLALARTLNTEDAGLAP